VPRTRGAPRDCIAPLWRLGLGVGSDFERSFMVLPREIELRVFFESTYDVLVENRIYEKKFHSGKKFGRCRIGIVWWYYYFLCKIIGNLTTII